MFQILPLCHPSAYIQHQKPGTPPAGRSTQHRATHIQSFRTGVLPCCPYTGMGMRKINPGLISTSRVKQGDWRRVRITYHTVTYRNVRTTVGIETRLSTAEHAWPRSSSRAIKDQASQRNNLPRTPCTVYAKNITKRLRYLLGKKQKKSASIQTDQYQRTRPQVVHPSNHLLTKINPMIPSQSTHKNQPTNQSTSQRPNQPIIPSIQNKNGPTRP